LGGRRLSAVLDRYGLARTAAVNVGAVLVAATGGGAATAAGWALIGLAVGGFCLLAAVAVATSRRGSP
jgi:hypothetical protein